MKFGQARQDGSEFDVHKWHDDTLPECLTDDQLWGYAIWAGEEMTENTWGGVMSGPLCALQYFLVSR